MRPLIWLLCLLIFSPVTGFGVEAYDQENFSDCFAETTVDKEYREKIKHLIENPPCFDQPFVKTFKEYLVICFFPQHYRNPLRECYYCQKIIAGSVQMYNFEHSPKIRRIKNSMLSQPNTPLIPEYLKHPFPKAEPECCYESIGDITASSGLFIYCTYHGSAQQAQELP
ncbi:MAG: hypothetical protein ACOYXC_03470 [Candidatus Rifleibacteriota bacterium]